MWLQFYGLNKQPFGVTPDPSFLCMGPARQEAFASMVLGIETGRGFMALIAAPGMGKTTLLLRLMEKLRDSAVTAFLFQVHTNSQEFLKNLLLDLDVKPVGQDMSDLQKQVREVLIRSSNAGKRMVLVIDEAQNLDDSVLEMVRMLSNFETPKAKLLQTILAGQPALADKLARPNLAQLRQRISIIAHFPPLNRDEIETYIDHRLRVAGFKGGRLFTPAAMDLIVRFSGGVPRIVNNLCFNAMSLSYAKGGRKIDELTLREVITDLSLESLRDPRGPARPATSQSAPTPRPAKDARPGPEVRSKSWATGDELLDSVDLTGYGQRGGGGTRRPLYSSRDSHGAGRNFGQQALLFLLAIAAVTVWTWRAPWLIPSLDFVVQAVQSAIGGSGEQETHPADRKREDAALAQGAKDEGAEGHSQPADEVVVPDGDKRNAQQAAIGSPDNGLRPATPAPSTITAPRAITPVKEKSYPGLMTLDAKGKNSISSVGVTSVDDMGATGLTGQLVVQCNFSGARISINGRNNTKWTAPRLFSLVAGTYTVSVSKDGYLGWARRVHINKGGEEWVTADLTYDQGSGVFIVDTQPAGMPVFIDGKPYGASRVEAMLRPGWHAYRVLPGEGLQPVTGQFHLNPGEALTKKIRVAPTTTSGTPSALLQPRGEDTSASTFSPMRSALE